MTKVNFIFKVIKNFFSKGQGMFLTNQSKQVSVFRFSVAKRQMCAAWQIKGGEHAPSKRTMGGILEPVQTLWPDSVWKSESLDFETHAGLPALLTLISFLTSYQPPKVQSSPVPSGHHTLVKDENQNRMLKLDSATAQKREGLWVTKALSTKETRVPPQSPVQVRSTHSRRESWNGCGKSGRGWTQTRSAPNCAKGPWMWKGAKNVPFTKPANQVRRGSEGKQGFRLSESSNKRETSCFFLGENFVKNLHLLDNNEHVLFAHSCSLILSATSVVIQE